MKDGKPIMRKLTCMATQLYPDVTLAGVTIKNESDDLEHIYPSNMIDHCNSVISFDTYNYSQHDLHFPKVEVNGGRRESASLVEEELKTVDVSDTRCCFGEKTFVDCAMMSLKQDDDTDTFANQNLGFTHPSSGNLGFHKNNSQSSSVHCENRTLPNQQHRGKTNSLPSSFKHHSNGSGWGRTGLSPTQTSVSMNFVPSSVPSLAIQLPSFRSLPPVEHATSVLPSIGSPSLDRPSSAKSSCAYVGSTMSQIARFPTPPSSYPGSPYSYNPDQTSSIGTHVASPPPPPPYPTTLVPMEAEVVSEDMDALAICVPLTPVTRQPRKTHPNCTTLKYERKTNPNLDERRIYRCDAAGQCTWSPYLFINILHVITILLHEHFACHHHTSSWTFRMWSPYFFMNILHVITILLHEHFACHHHTSSWTFCMSSPYFFMNILHVITILLHEHFACHHHTSSWTFCMSSPYFFMNILHVITILLHEHFACHHHTSSWTFCMSSPYFFMNILHVITILLHKPFACHHHTSSWTFCMSSPYFFMNILHVITILLHEHFACHHHNSSWTFCMSSPYFLMNILHVITILLHEHFACHHHNSSWTFCMSLP